MQLLEIVLYNAVGRQRRVEFSPAELNIVTGESQTGKSALLAIVEYCLGRTSFRVPAGPIDDTVSWYATLWQLDGNARAFVARPKPAGGTASNSQAMVEFGGADLAPLAFDHLGVNADSSSLREQLGRRIGIGENLTESGPQASRPGFEANIGHASLLCLQAQGEIANQNQLFHRQGERGIEQALRDTLPYFLGAVPADRAVKRAQLHDAQRRLSRAAASLEAAELAAQTMDVELRALANEARAAGLTTVREDAAPNDLLAALQIARQATAETAPPLSDTAAQDRRLALEEQARVSRNELRRLMADRRLLLEDSHAEQPYTSALEQHAGRLTSLGLLPGSEPGQDDSASCPACGQSLHEPDPTAEQLNASLSAIREQLRDLAAAAPRRQRALTDLDQRAAAVREELQAQEAALASLLAADAATQQSGSQAAARDFTRGRIDAILARAATVDDLRLAGLRLAKSAIEGEVAGLQAELDVDEEREQLTSRLVAISRDMTGYANRLSLEHAGESVRLDLARLTVVTDTPTGPTPLYQIGSAANWIGYHLVTHLALHRYFVEQDRPVPRLLMLDQPTQAYYPSEASQLSGIPETDADRRAVLAIFELLRDTTAELAPRFQVIVCDHANLGEEWFAAAVRHNWRDGRKLIPVDWLEQGR